MKSPSSGRRANTRRYNKSLDVVTTPLLAGDSLTQLTMMFGLLLTLLICPAVTFADIDCGGESHCPDGETCCNTPLGYICCLEGCSCVEEIKTCIPNDVIKFGAKLLKLLSASGLFSLSTQRGDQLKHATGSCADDMTICENKCCPLPDAICCSGGQHCCPLSYRCDVAGERCVTGDGTVMPIYDMKESTRKLPNVQNFTSLKSKFPKNYVNCPDGSKCPDGYTCCTSPSGYLCCPNGRTFSPIPRESIPNYALKNRIKGASNNTSVGLRIKKLKGVICDRTTSCSDGDTCCQKFPFGYTCCPSLSICIPYVGKCIPITDPTRRSDVSSKSFADPTGFFSGNYVPCPSGNISSHQMTSCGSECCPFPKAVCCSKGSFCCPSGFLCNDRGRGCVVMDNEMGSANKTSEASRSLMENVVCPDKSKCPDGNSCCPAQGGSYSCCPPGSWCVPIVGMCLPSHVARSRLYPATHWSASVPPRLGESGNVVRCTKGSCSYQNTCCDFGCCAFRNAVCCSDKRNCCPSGYECGASGLCKFGWGHPNDGTFRNASSGSHSMMEKHLSVK